MIQYIYEKYGRDRAGLAATVICYRGRSAVREVGKAMGLSLDTRRRAGRQLWGWSDEGVADGAGCASSASIPRSRGCAMTLELDAASSSAFRAISPSMSAASS